jgi:hypothetical protein
MSATTFAYLPTEIKLNILSQTCEKIPTNVSLEWNDLSKYITSQKLQHYLNSNSLFISFFCPNSKTSNKKLIYSLIPQQGLQECSFQIAELVKSQEIIPIQATSKDHYYDHESTNHLDLLVDEEQSSVRLHIQLRINEQIIKEASILLNLSDFEKDTEKEICKNDALLKLEIMKGEEEERGGYDFTDLINYSMNLKNFKIKSSELIECIERKEGCMVVKY